MKFDDDLFGLNVSPAGVYLLKVNNRNTRTRCEICSKLTIKTPEQRHWRRSDVFIVNYEHISHLVLVFLLLIRTSMCAYQVRNVCLSENFTYVLNGPVFCDNSSRIIREH